MFSCAEHKSRARQNPVTTWFNRLLDNGTGGGAYGVRRQSGAATALSHPAYLMFPTALQKRCRAALATAVHIHARQAVITANLNASALASSQEGLTSKTQGVCVSHCGASPSRAKSEARAPGQACS